MTKNEIFNKVATHLLKQNKRSENEVGGSTCLYRGPYGLKCAAGVLIPDDVYEPRMENTLIMDLCMQYVSLRNLIGAENIPMVQALQHVHDCVPPSHWRGALVGVGLSFDVSVSQVEGLQFL